MTGGLLIKAILIGGLIVAMITGINIPLILLDLILKTLNIISGNAFFKSIFSQAFEPSNPIFIIYISVFLISFVLSLLFIIKASLQSTMNHNEFKEKNRNKSMIHKWKWLGFWAIGFILVPLIFFLINFIISQISGIFGGNFFGIAGLTSEDWINYEEILNLKIENFNTNISNWITGLENLDPNLGYDVNLINILKTKLINIQAEISEITVLLKDVFNNQSGILDSDILKKIQTLFIELEKNITNLKYNFSSNGELFPLLNIGIEPENSYFNSFINSFQEFNNVVIGDFNFGNNDNKNLSLGNFIIRGIDNNITGNYIPEHLTIQLSKLIYGYEKWDLFPPSFAYITGGSIGIFDGFKLLGTALASIFTFLLNPIKLFEMFLGTLFVAIILSSFLGITLMLAKRLFEFVTLIIISPVVLANGINDSGAKFELWFKTILGKQFLVLSVTFAISIFNLLIVPLLKTSDEIILSVDIFGPAYSIGAAIATLVLKGLMLIASSIAMVEFIEWLNTFLNDNSKLTAVGKGFMKKTSSLIDTKSKNFSDSEVGKNIKKEAMRRIKTRRASR